MTARMVCRACGHHAIDDGDIRGPAWVCVLLDGSVPGGCDCPACDAGDYIDAHYFAEAVA